MRITDKQRDEIVAEFAEGKVTYEHRFSYGDFMFQTKEQGRLIIRDGVNILAQHQKGEAIYSHSYDNGDIEFETKEQGCLLIRDGVNILEPYQDGKAIYCTSFGNGGFEFRTQNQGEVYITKAQHEAKMKEINSVFLPFMSALSQTGLGDSAVTTLAQILEHGASPMGDISKACGVTTASTTGTVDRLTKKGLVTRDHREGDRRVVEVSLTDEGKRIIKNLKAIFDA